MRSDILRRDAEDKLLAPLRMHGWKTEVEHVEEVGEYLVLMAERNGLRLRAALLYTSATANTVYRRLEAEVDLTLFNGEPYELAQFAQGLARPPVAAADFQHHLIEWNRASVPERVAPKSLYVSPEEPTIGNLRDRRLLSETPIDAVWLRLSRLRSATLARKAVAGRAAARQAGITDQVACLKGDGVAYAVRSAMDYFLTKDVGILSQRVLSLYYGCVSLVFAEMLAAPDGPAELSTIEDTTKQGYGLWTFPGADDGFGSLAVGPNRSGLFPA